MKNLKTGFKVQEVYSKIDPNIKKESIVTIFSDMKDLMDNDL